MSFGFRDASFLTASENDDLDEVVDEGADHMTNASRLQHADQIMHFSLTIVHRKGRKSRQYNQSPLIVCPSRPAFHQSSLGPSSGTSHVGGTNEGQEAGAAPNGSKPTKGTISPAAAATTALADSFVPALFLGDLFIPSSSVGLFHSQVSGNCARYLNRVGKHYGPHSRGGARSWSPTKSTNSNDEPRGETASGHATPKSSGTPNPKAIAASQTSEAWGWRTIVGDGSKPGPGQTNTTSSTGGTTVKLEPGSQLLLRMALGHGVGNERLFFVSEEDAEDCRKQLVLERYEVIMQGRKQAPPVGRHQALNKLEDLGKSLSTWVSSLTNSQPPQGSAFTLGRPHRNHGKLPDSTANSLTLQIDSLLSELKNSEEEAIIKEAESILGKAHPAWWGRFFRPERASKAPSFGPKALWGGGGEREGEMKGGAGGGENPSYSYTARFPLEPAFQLLMHQPDKHNLLSNDLDSTLAIATKNFDTEVPLCSSKHSLAIVSYSDSEDDSETIDTLAEALDLVSKSGGTPGGTSRGATDSMTPHDGGTPGNTPSGTPDSTARVAPGVATSPNASKSAEGGAADNYPKPEPNSNPNMHLLSKIRGAAQGGLRTLRGGAKDKVFPSPPVDSETGTDTETGTETGSEEMDTEEYMLEQIKEGENKTPLFVIRGVELKLSFGDGQKMLLRPAFLSMGQVYKVVDVCKDVLKKAWLKGRHDARISTLHQVQDLAAKLSGLDAGRSYSGGGPASTAAVVSDSPSENGEDDDGMGEPPEAKELMRELGESGTKRMANVTFHNVLDDIISPPKPEGVLEVVNTLVFGTISAFGQSLCTVADVADSVVINTMLGMLMLVGLPRSLNLVAGHLEDFGTEMAIRNLLRSGLKTSQANHGCLSTNGGHGATPPVLSHPTTPASMGAPVLPTPGGSTVPPASSDGTAALPKPTGSDPSRVTSAVADKVADNVAEVVAGQKQDQTTERSGNQIPASTNTNSPPTGPPTPNPDEVDITMEVQPTLSTLLERMELQDHLQNELQQQKQQLLTGQHALSKVQVLLEQQLLTEKQSILEETQGLLKKQYHLLVERLELKAKQQEQQRQQKQLESLTGLSMMWQLGWLALAEMRLDGGLSANQLLPLLGNAAHFPLALDDLSLQITFKSARVEAPTGGGPLAGKDKAGKGKTTTDETTTEVGLDISCRDLFGLFEYQKPADSAGPKPAEALTAAPGSAPPPPSPNTTKASARSPTTSAAKDASELDDAMEGLIIIGNLGLEKEVEDSWWSPPSMGFANLAPLLARHANKHGSS